MLVDSQEELEMLIDESKKKQHHSNYRFINSHNSYRNGKMHLAIGPSSGGKSTLTRSLLLDFMLNLDPGEKVHVHLSEEDEETFLIEMGSSGIGFDKLKNLIITSEQDSKYSSAKDLLKMIEASANRNDVRGLFFDNITTSMCYMDKGHDNQAIVSSALKNICRNCNKPFVLIAHTGGAQGMATQRMLEMNDIRGGKSIVNLVEFMYILQPIFCGEERHNILTVVKHRGVSVTKPYYRLVYVPKAKIFACDESITFEQYKQIFKERNTL